MASADGCCTAGEVWGTELRAPGRLLLVSLPEVHSKLMHWKEPSMSRIFVPGLTPLLHSMFEESGKNRRPIVM